jgi:hypothetical protein
LTPNGENIVTGIGKSATLSKSHPLAEQRGRYPNIEWSVDISEPEDLLTLAGSTEKITIYCRRDDPTIEIDDEVNEIDDEENE